MSDIPLSSVQSNGGTQVGDFVAMPDVGQLVTRISGDKLLRTGSVALAANYPVAATLDYLKCTGTASTQTTAISTNYTDIATDGAGRWVIAYANGINVLVSTDNGATFATVAHNAGGAVTSVCYTPIGGGLFISAGNSASQFFTSSVAAANVGSAWTARTPTTFSTGTGNTALVRSSSSEVIMTCASSTSAGVSRSTNGTSWTSANFIASPYSDITSSLASLVSYGGSVWVVAGGSAGNVQRSTDGGVTWATVTGGESSIRQGAYSPSLGLSVNFASSGNLWTSTTGATGTWTNRGNPFSGWRGLNVVWDGTRFIASIESLITSADMHRQAYAYSTDGLTWNIRGFLNKRWTDNVPTRIGSDGTNLLFAPIHFSTSGAVYGTFAASTFIGIPYPVGAASGSANVNGTVQYLRVS